MGTQSTPKCSFLHLDDDAAEVFFVREAARITGLPFHIEPFFAGEEVLAYIAGESPFADARVYPFPAFVLLDYDLKVTTAPPIIRVMRKLPRGKALPIIVYSNSVDEEGVLRSYQAGADHFLKKAVGLSRAKVILETLYRCATSAPPNYDALMDLEEHRRYSQEARGPEAAPRAEW